MDNNSGPTASDDPDADGKIVTTEIEPDPETAEYDLLEIIADLDGVDITDLPSLYDQMDHFVETLFETPPAPEAQLELSFSYAGYRISVDQTGAVTLVNVKNPVE